jgi:hypothetical protein
MYTPKMVLLLNADYMPVNYLPTPEATGWASEVSTPTNAGSSFRVLVSVPDT